MEPHIESPSQKSTVTTLGAAAGQLLHCGGLAVSGRAHSPRRPSARRREQHVGSRPDPALRAQSQKRLEYEWITQQSEKGSEVGQRVQPPRRFPVSLSVNQRCSSGAVADNRKYGPPTVTVRSIRMRSSGSAVETPASTRRRAARWEETAATPPAT